MRPASPLRPHDRLRQDWLPAALAGLVLMATAVTSFFLTVFFQEDLGFSGFQIGLLYAAQAAAGLLAALPAGLGNDRIRSRGLVSLGLLGQALAFLGMASVRAYLPFLLVFMVWSASNWVFRLSLDVQLLKTDGGDRTGARIGLYHAVRFLGMALGTVATGHLVAGADFPVHLRLVAGLCALLALAALALPSTPLQRVRLRDYAADLKDRRVRLFALWMFLFTLHWGAETTSYGLFLRRNLELSMGQMGWYMAVEYLAIVAAVLLLGRRTVDLPQLRRLAILGLTASGLGQVGMIFPPVGLSAAFRGLHGLGDGAMLIVLYFGIARLFAVERLGGNTGFINTVTMLGFIAGSLVFGPLGESFGYALPLWTSGLLTLALALPLVLLHRAAREALAAHGPRP